MPKAATPAPTGGDGAATSTPAEVVDSSNLPQLVDASKNEAELEQHITEVLGLPTEQPVEAKADEVQTQTDETVTPPVEAGNGKPNDSVSGQPDASDNSESGKDEASVVQPTEPPAKVEPAPAVTTPLELKLTDADGKEFIVKPGDDIDVVLKDFNPTGTGQVMRVIEQVKELNQQAEAAKASEQEQAQAAAQQAEMKQIVDSWDKEIVGLQNSGRLGKPAVAPTDPNYLQDPVAQRVDAVFKFMTAENKARAEASQKNGTAFLPIRSFEDALDKFELKETKEAQAKAKQQELDAAKQKSAVIGGGSGNVTASTAPLYRPGQAKNIWDL